MDIADEPAFGRKSTTRRRQRPVQTMALFASLRQSARVRAASVAAAAAAVAALPKTRRRRRETHEQIGVAPPQPAAAAIPQPVPTASSFTQQQQQRLATGEGASMPPPTCASLPLASQLPTFSLEHGESYMDCGLLQPTAATQRAPSSAVGGAHVGTRPKPSSLHHGQQQQQQHKQRQDQATVPSASGPSSSRASRCCIATEQVFAGPGVLPGMRARLQQEVEGLHERGLEGTYRCVMQEMALQAVLRKELEYVVPEGPERGRRRQQQQGYYALEALGQAVLAPARHLLPAKARVLGISDELMANIGLLVQEEAAAAAIAAGAIES